MSQKKGPFNKRKGLSSSPSIFQGMIHSFWGEKAFIFGHSIRVDIFARILWFWSAEENDASGLWPDTVPSHSKELPAEKPSRQQNRLDHDISPICQVGNDEYVH